MDYIISDNILIKYTGVNSKVVLPVVKKIGESAFYNNQTIECVTFSDGIESLEPWSFGYCESLKHIYLSKTIKDIHPSAFDGCCSLERIEIDQNNSRYYCNDGVLYNKDGSSLLFYPRGKKNDLFKINEDVVSVEDNAFNRSENLLQIEIGQSVQTIGYKAFAYCIGLKRIFIPQNINSIGYCAFANCTGLTEFLVDKNNPFFSSVEGCLFSKDKKKLIQYPLGADNKSYYIEESTMEIEERAFSCSNLERIIVSPNNLSFKDVNGVLFSLDGKQLLFYPKFKKQSRYCIPSGVEVICNSAFKDNNYIEELTFPESLKKIDRHAFENCAKIKLLDFTSTVLTEIGWSAFAECSSVVSVLFPIEKKLIIQGHAFFNCNSLEKVITPKEIVSLGYEAFGGNTKFRLHF